jgi:hypothetical protein
MNELLNCPFCEGEAEYTTNSLLGDKSIATCKRCGASAFWKKWQTRAVPDTRQLVEQRDALEVALRFLIRSVDDLIAESEGVYGLHLNGDPAPWDSLTEGGRFEAWLIELERARAALTSLDKPAIIDGPHGPEFCERLP